MGELRHLLSLVACVLVCAAPVWAQRGMGNVSGKVVSQNGQAIRKVIVELKALNPEFDDRYTTATDALGVFRLEGVAEGDYAVRISRAGYFPASKKSEMQVTVEAGQEVNGLLYRMDAAGVIAGKIVDRDGDAVPQIGVVVRPRVGAATGSGAETGSVGQGTTDDRGEFRIANLAAGMYVVEAQPAGQGPAPIPEEKGRAKQRVVYVDTFFPGSVDEKQAGVVLVRAGETAAANFTLMTSEAYRVSGAVVDAPKATMRGIQLIAKSGVMVQQDLDDGGRFEFPSVQPGTYEARVMLVNGDPANKPTVRFELIRAPVVVGNEDVTGLELQPEAGGAVNGKLRAEGPEKVGWALMKLKLVPVSEAAKDPDVIDIDLGNSGEVNPTDDGSFEFKDVEGGTYRVQVAVNSDLYRDYYVKSVKMDGHEVVDTGFAMNGGATLDVVMSAKGAAVAGKVLDSSGNQLVDAYVVCVPSLGASLRPDAYQQVQTDSFGNYELHGINPGEFVVVAMVRAPGDVRSAEFLQKWGEKGVKVSLTEGEKKSLELRVTN